MARWLFAGYGIALAADPYSDGYTSIRSLLNESYNDYARTKRTDEFGRETISIRSLVRGILDDAGVRAVKEK